jgi:hypothetical protein
VATLDELRAAARQALLELSLCAAAPAQLLTSTTTSSRPSSAPPRRTDDVVGHYRERFAAATTADELEHELEHAKRELALLKARPDGDVRTETFVELAARIVAHGETLPALDVAVAVRSSEALVRRARLLAGRDAETGRQLPLDVVNGRPLTFACGLVDAGYSVRAASVLSGVARSTLHDAVAARR